MKNAAIGIVIAEDTNEVLLVKRRDIPIWVLPGGGIEEGEKPESAVVRELKEETGINVEIVRKVAEYLPHNRLFSLAHVFECRSAEAPLTTTREARKVAFFSLDAMPRPFLWIHRDWINDALKKHAFVIRKTISRASYLHGLLYAVRHPVIALCYLYARCHWRHHKNDR